jgi:hypothetical protein
MEPKQPNEDSQHVFQSAILSHNQGNPQLFVVADSNCEYSVRISF